ncbi:MAG: hypothetical protein ACREIT_06795, partial [Tepidisphaeraceae bacterium]
HDTQGPRLVEDARRLWLRVGHFLYLRLVGPDSQLDALQLACHALQLPMRQSKALPIGRLGRTNLRERAEQAAELLVTLLGEDIDEELLDRTTRVIHELPQRSPMLDEAKLLADAVNLDDFGVSGIVLQTIQLATKGEGLAQVAEGLEKREQYGYWEARLKDGFHFEPIRQMARRRLESARGVAKLLLAEVREDQAS